LATPNANSRTDTVQTEWNLHEAEHVLYLRARAHTRDNDECECDYKCEREYSNYRSQVSL